jgi:hypothetical protein
MQIHKAEPWALIVGDGLEDRVLTDDLRGRELESVRVLGQVLAQVITMVAT